MKKAILIFILVLPLLMHAQGIKFEQGLTWQQIKAKAKQENKFIFVDASASWCLPCKKMDKEVFPLKNVGDYMNANFISVHVQMDTSKTDDEHVKAWYTDAHSIQQQHKVTAFPTYLFFSPEGKIVHRYLGLLPDSLFLKITANALDPDKQYYNLLEKYYAPKIDLASLRYLAILTKQIGEESFANKIAKEYLKKYLNKANSQAILQKKNLDFINTFPSLVSSKDAVFVVLYQEGDKANEVMNQKDFSQSLVRRVITDEEINPKIWPGNKPISGTPKWSELFKNIERKYDGDIAGLLINNAQITWYDQQKDWEQLIKYWVKKQDKYGLDTAGLGWVFINNFAWDVVFYHCNNADTLNKVAGWMKTIIDFHPEDNVSIDTYANLLYKAGRTNEAIEWEEKAVQIETEKSRQKNKKPDLSFQKTLEKMRKGVATWEK